MSDELTLKEKSTILFKHGLIRWQDRTDAARIEARWVIYQTVPQQTATRGPKPKP